VKGLTSADVLDRIADVLPAALVGPAELALIRRVADRLPMSATLGFESALASPAAAVDLGVAFQAGEESRVLAGLHPDQDLSGDLSPHPAWQHTRVCAAALQNVPSVDQLWLEFDLPDAAQGVPVPSLFLGVAPTVDVGWVTDTAIPLLAGCETPVPLRGRLDSCLRHLPTHACAFQVGAMHARHDPRVRLCLGMPSWTATTSYLTNVGWPGPIDAVAEVATTLAPLVPRVALDLEIGADIGPRIGVECYPSLSRRPEIDPAWPRLLEWLVAAGLCLPEKRDGLLAWPGYRVETIWWPRVFARRLHHVKLVFDQNGLTGAKAYFGVVQTWLDRGGSQ